MNGDGAPRTVTVDSLLTSGVTSGGNHELIAEHSVSLVNILHMIENNFTQVDRVVKAGGFRVLIKHYERCYKNNRY